MVSNYVNGQRKISEHIGEDDGDCTERPGKTEVVQRRDSSKQAKSKDEHNRDDEEDPNGGVRRLVSWMNLAEELRQKTFAPGAEKDARLRVDQADQRAQDAGHAGDIRYHQQGGCGSL